MKTAILFAIFFLSSAGSGEPATSEEENGLHFSFPFPPDAVINVSSSRCPSQKYSRIDLKKCSGRRIQTKYVGCEDLLKGKLVCLSFRFQGEECAQIDLNRRLQGRVDLRAIDLDLDMGRTIDSSWSRREGSNTSQIFINKAKMAPIYKMQLTPIKAQGCSVDDETTLDGRVVSDDGHVFFDADWNDLDVDCSYGVLVTPYRHCPGEALSGGVILPDLEYTPFPKTTFAERPSTWNEALVVVVPSLVGLVSLACASLIIACRYHRRKAQMDPAKDDGDDADGASLNDADADDASLNAASSSSLVLVYARDVSEEVNELAHGLRARYSGKVVDLYETGDAAKMADGASWLAERLRDVTTRFLLVWSEEMALRVHHNIQDGRRPHPLGPLLDAALGRLSDAHAHDDAHEKVLHAQFGGAARRHLGSGVMTSDRLYSLPRHYGRLVADLGHLEP